MNYIFTEAVLLTSTIGKFSVSKDITKPVTDFNGYLFTAITYAGAILIALAILKFILSYTESSPGGKQSASMLFGFGILLVSGSSVVKVLNVTADSTSATIFANIMGIIGSITTFVGVLLLIAGIFQFITSIQSEQPEGKMNASREIGISIALLGASGITSSIVALFNKWSGTVNMASYFVNLVIEVVSTTSAYIGAPLLILGIFTLVCGLKEEDSAKRNQAAVQIGIAIALLSMAGILAFLNVKIAKPPVHPVQPPNMDIK